MTNGNERLAELAPGRWAHASGALWLSNVRTLVMADVHLGYGWALRRRGQLGPVSDDKVCQKLMAVVEELIPDTIVFLGDLVHAPRPAPPERSAVENTIHSLSHRARIVVVLGNHDRGLVKDFPHLPAEVCREWHSPGLIAVHGDREIPKGEHVIAGHIHPALGVSDHAGASHRMPVFVAGDTITLLPAFSPLASGVDIRGGLRIRVGDARIVAASGKRAVNLGLLSRIRLI
ncbi:MAG: metallophosphoesterase [Bryobacteraceae bacterium]|nr:metallophosphoesterase [Bryobacteraceae bacterium]